MSAKKAELDLDNTVRDDRLMEEFTGLYIPLITPFTSDGALDAAALERLAERVLDDGASGLVALGTTAETPTLTEQERAEVLRICDRVCQDRGVPLIAGAGINDTARTVAAIANLARYPSVRAALVVVPYYTRPGEAGVRAHFTALAEVSHVSVVIYNIPYRTGQALSWHTLATLAELPRIAGVKHAAGSLDQDTMAMLGARPAGFSVLGGDDLYILTAARARCPGWHSRLGARLHEGVRQPDQAVAGRRGCGGARARAPAAAGVASAVRRAQPGSDQVSAVRAG